MSESNSRIKDKVNQGERLFQLMYSLGYSPEDVLAVVLALTALLLQECDTSMRPGIIDTITKTINKQPSEATTCPTR